MKISHLLEYPANVAGPLARAREREANKPITQFGTVGAKRAAGQGQMPPIGAPTAGTPRPPVLAQTPSGPAPLGSVKPATNPVSVANPQMGTKPATAPTTVPATAPGPTGDPTLNKPLPAKAPKDPNAPGIGTRIGQGIGQAAKAAGAVAGGVVGVGRALKKGFQAGANTVGGPGAAPATQTMAAPAGGGAAADDELANLKSMLQTMDQRMRRAGL